MQLPKLPTEKVFGWRAASYPHDDFPAIAEILEWLGGEGHGQPRFLRTPQVRAIETYWYMRLVERTPGIFDLYRDLIPKKVELRKALGLTSDAAREYAEENGWERTMTDKLYGVICDNTGFLIFLDHAPDAEAACRLATREAARWGALGPCKRSLMGAPKDDGRSWLELSVFDVTGVLEPDPDPIPDDESLMCAMDEENFAARFIAEQLS